MVFLSAKYDLKPFVFKHFAVSYRAYFSSDRTKHGKGVFPKETEKVESDLLLFEDSDPVEAFRKFQRWQIDNEISSLSFSSTVDGLVFDAPDLAWSLVEFEHGGNIYEAEMLVRVEGS